MSARRRLHHSPAPPSGSRVTPMDDVGPGLVVMSVPLAQGRDPFEALSTAEREVAHLAIRGLSNAEIAQMRGTRVRTVANQMASIFDRLGVVSRAELAARYAFAVPLDD